jgi:hypothetical protein
MARPQLASDGVQFRGGLLVCEFVEIKRCH